jgi:hypothetical protein
LFICGNGNYPRGSYHGSYHYKIITAAVNDYGCRK